ncbi:MAG: phosphoribosylamine--glycine ligase [Bacteroidota bacterium]
MKTYNILLLGSGGREHTFAWKLKQSPQFGHLWIAPGNAGTASIGTNVAINPNNFEAVKQVVLDQSIEIVIVGPEEPLVRGIVDFFAHDEQLKSIPVIGPAADGAQLEGSKAFAKAFMAEFDIPTAGYREFNIDQLAAGLAYLDQQKPPIVLKADGLAAGKGVLILDNVETAKAEFENMLNGKFGKASERIVVEAFLDGIEFSVFVLTDGTHYQLLPIAKDYKRIGEGDTGLNTGGMGAVSPVPFVDDTLLDKVTKRIIEPTIQGIQARNMNYKGFIFFGLIRVGNDPYVIEYNCRMGDPETEVVFPRLKSDLLELILATANGTLVEQSVEFEAKAATTIMLVSGGYPEAYEKGKAMSGIESVEESIPFHAGTKIDGDQIRTNGGRVMALTSYGTDFHEALAKSNRSAERVQFDGKNYRKDIGFDL